uniref:Uncharacterized protein n=2 Tax=Octactis speculum TaxID=3111310 RepID=A0A7S2DDJ0_9STRA|mmetsp:Transcript_47414/g.64544  ORF Transcript_47414/g.64544 Transcript_47414/m.64544 type:complete len:144 (+) Transcript_47414:170-601(+)
MLSESLGLAPKRRRNNSTALEEQEVRQLIAKGEMERDDVDVERVEGLGAGASRGHEHMPKKTLVEKELARRAKEAEDERRVGRLSGVEGSERQESRASEKSRRHSEKKERKREKKERKRAKKEKKRERKRSERDSRSGSESLS